MKKLELFTIVFISFLVISVDASWLEKTKSLSNFLWSFKEKIPPKVRDKIGVAFGGLATAYNIKWMWDCTFSGDTNTNRDEKIKGILLNKLESDQSIDIFELKHYKRLIISGGSEIPIIYSHCVENRWFHQTTCIMKDLDELDNPHHYNLIV